VTNTQWLAGVQSICALASGINRSGRLWMLLFAVLTDAADCPVFYRVGMCLAPSDKEGGSRA